MDVIGRPHLALLAIPGCSKSPPRRASSRLTCSLPAAAHSMDLHGNTGLTPPPAPRDNSDECGVDGEDEVARCQGRRESRQTAVFLAGIPGAAGTTWDGDGGFMG